MAATLQQQLDAINDAIARGVREYTNPADGSRVVYNSLSELMAAQTALEAKLAVEGAGEGGYLGFGVGGELGA